jgi:hypothetical protein
MSPAARRDPPRVAVTMIDRVPISRERRQVNLAT